MLDDIVDEYRGAEFGDARLSQRLVTSASKLADDPSRPYPHAMSTEADIEGIYRFFGNENVTTGAILEPHFGQTTARAQECGDVVAIHDSTEMTLTSEEGGGFYELSTKTYGYLAHTSLIATADGSIPLGLLGLTIPTRDYERDPEMSEKQHFRQRWSAPDKESRRWYLQTQEIEARLGSDVDVIHVMDREADSYEIFKELDGFRYVIRMTHDRRVQTGDDGSSFSRVSTELEGAPALVTRKVEIAARSGKMKTGKKSPPSRRRKHPARAARTATVEMRAVGELKLARPHNIPVSFPETIRCNVVEVREPDPPEGCEALHWLLCTTEPVDSAEDVQRVVDLYLGRWLIEDFYKALKTGCALNERRPESLHTASNGFALLAVMAWHLVLLRQLERVKSTAPATAALSRKRITTLRKIVPAGTLPPNPRVHHLVSAFARLGGHLKSNGPPGWMVLGRGFRDFLRTERLLHRLEG